MPQRSGPIRQQVAIGMARVLAGDEGVEWIRAGVQSLTEQPISPMTRAGRTGRWSAHCPLPARNAAPDEISCDTSCRSSRTARRSVPCPNLLCYTARDDATTEPVGLSTSRV